MSLIPDRRRDSFRDGAREDVYLAPKTKMFGRSGAGIAKDADTMRVINDDQSVELPCEINDRRKGSKDRPPC